MALSSDQKQEITNINIGLLSKLIHYPDSQTSGIPVLTLIQIQKIAQEITERFNNLLGSKGISDDIISKARKDLNNKINDIITHYVNIPDITELNIDGGLADINKDFPVVNENTKKAIAKYIPQLSDLIVGFKDYLDAENIDVKEATDLNFKDYLKSLETEGHSGSQITIPFLTELASDTKGGGKHLAPTAIYNSIVAASNKKHNTDGSLDINNLDSINNDDDLDEIKKLIDNAKKYPADQMPSEYPLIDKLRNSGLVANGKIKINDFKKYLTSLLNTDSAGSDVLSILAAIEETFPELDNFKKFEKDKKAADLNNADGTEDYAIAADIVQDDIVEKIALAFGITKLPANATEEEKAKQQEKIAEAKLFIDKTKNIMANKETEGLPEITDKLVQEIKKQNTIILGPEMIIFPENDEDDWTDFGGKLWIDWMKETFGGSIEEVGENILNFGKDILEIIADNSGRNPTTYLKSELRLENERDGISTKGGTQVIRIPEAKRHDYAASYKKDKEVRLTYGNDKNSSLYNIWITNFYIKSKEFNPNWNSVNENSLEAKSPYRILLDTVEGHNYGPDEGKAEQIVSIYNSSLNSPLLKNMDIYLGSMLDYISSREVVKAIRNALGDKNFDKGSPVIIPRLDNESDMALLSLNLISWYDYISAIPENDDENKKDFGSIKTEIISMLPVNKKGDQPLFELYPEALKKAKEKIKERDGVSVFLEKLNEYKFDLNHPSSGIDEKVYNIDDPISEADGTVITLELNSFFKDITQDINSYIKFNKIQKIKNNLRPELRKLKDPENPDEEKEPGEDGKLLPVKADQIASKNSKERFFRIMAEDEETNILLNPLGKDKDKINFYISTRVDRKREIDISGKEDWGNDKLDKQKIADEINRVGISLKPKTLSIEKMLLSGPDLYSNMFDVIIAWNPKHPLGTEDYLKNRPPAALNIREKILLSQACLITRFNSITIPTPVKNIFSTAYQMRSVERLASNVNFDRKSQFTIDADENLFVLDFIQNLAGHTGKLEPFDATNSVIKTLKSAAEQVGIQLMSNNIGFLKEISKTFPWEGRKGQDRRRQGLNQDLSEQGLCIIVKEKFLSDYLYENGILKINSKKEPYWIFENVRILGTSNPVKFSRDEVNKHTFTVEFIFRRCYRLIDP